MIILRRGRAVDSSPAARRRGAPAGRGKGISNASGRFLRSPLLLFFLVGLHPAVFLLSRNWFIYSGSQTRALLIGTPAVTLLLGCLLAAAGAALAAAATRLPLVRALHGSRERIGNCLCALFAASIYFFLLQATFFSPYDPLWWRAMVLAAVAVCLLALVAATGLSTLNVMLSAMVLTASWGWVSSRHQTAGAAPAYWNETDKGLVEKLRFASRPNVYLVHLESVQGREALERIYGFDSSGFEADLARLGFRVLDGRFANYSNTLSSLSSLFAMRHHYARIAMGNHDALGARELIGGKAYNPVLRAFLNNGYRCQIVFPSSFAFDPSDDWWYAFPRLRLLNAARIYQSRTLDRLIDGIVGREPETRDFDALLRRRVAEAAAGPAPTLSILSPPWSDHSPVDRKWSEMSGWQREYSEKARKSQEAYLGLARLIAERDPGAVVVLFGDHGAWRYRKILEGPRGLVASMEANGVPGSTLALDYFGVFLAIRFPGGDPARLAPVSLVNLMRAILAELSGSAELRGAAVEDDSYYTGDKGLYVAVRGGRPLETWELSDRR